MKTYFKFMLGLYGFALVVAGACRVILKLWYIDVTTGFYMGGDVYAFLFTALLAAAPLIMFISNRLKKADGDYPVYTRSGFLSFLAILAGASIIALAIVGAPQSQLEQGHSKMFYQIGAYLSLGLGVLSGLAFIYLGVGGVFGRDKQPVALIVVIPAVWQIVLLITRYNGYTTVTTITDHLLIVLFMVFNALFLLGHARTVCGLMRRDGRNYAIPSGLCASLCGFLLVIPNYVFMAFYAHPMPTPLLGYVESACILAMSLYALCFATDLVRSIRKV